MTAAPTLPIRLSRRGALALGVAGLLVAALAALIPVSVHFADDPLLNLRRLDPRLDPAQATADCGSPVRNLAGPAAGADFYDLARAGACQQASRRRVSAGLAVAALLVTAGFLGLVNARSRRSTGTMRDRSVTLRGGLGERYEHGRRG